MDTSRAFLSGDTAANVLRGVYEPGSRGVLSAWARQAKLVPAEDGTGLAGCMVPTCSLASASGSSRYIGQVLARCPVPQDLLGDAPEVLFGADHDKARAIGLKPRLWTTALPEGAFIELSHEVRVSSPAFTFVLRASQLGAFGAMRYGNELCGRFSIDGSTRGMNNHAPFTTLSQIKAFTAECIRGRGLKNARVAAKWIRQGFRSPKESDIYLLLCLPRDYGAYGFGRTAEVNARVEVDPKLRYIAGVGSYEVDLLWRRAKAVVEYDGEPHHDPQQKLRDDLKTHVLEKMGYEVFRLTWDMVKDERELDWRARMLGDRLGEPVPYSTRDFKDKRKRLREAVLYGPQ